MSPLEKFVSLVWPLFQCCCSISAHPATNVALQALENHKMLCLEILPMSQLRSTEQNPDHNMGRKCTTRSASLHTFTGEYLQSKLAVLQHLIWRVGHPPPNCYLIFTPTSLASLASYTVPPHSEILLAWLSTIYATNAWHLFIPKAIYLSAFQITSLFIPHLIGIVM